MYRVLYGADVLYDPRDLDLVLTGMKAELALNETGSFEFSMPLAHPHRDSIALMQKHREIVLEQDGEVLFRGRAVRCEKGFFGDAEYRCEGERAYLNDVALPPYSTTQPGVPSTVDGLFNWYVSQYNAKVPPGQRFLAGVNQGAELDPNNHVLRESSGRSYVWPELKEKLLGKLGGYVRVRHEGGLRYIDYLASGDRASAQRIEFGVNLLDYARLQDATRFCTRVVPVGAEVEDAEGNGTGVKLSISDLPDGPLRQGYEKVGDAVVNIEAERVCGVIEQVVEFEDVTVARNLLDRALRHAVNVVVGDTMELTAVDLHLVDPSVERIRLGDYVRACSKPHGFDEYFMCARLTIYPDDPGANKFVLGSEYDTLTGRQSAKIASLNASIVKQHDAVKQIDQAAKDAAKKADAAQGSADKAQTDADAAKLAADAAKAEADKAFADATQAAADALAAKRKADEATAKVEVAESEMTVVKQAVAGAEAASSAAQLAAGEADAKAGAAQTAASEAKTSAGTAVRNAAAAIATADAATAQAASAKADAAQVRTDLAGQIKTVTDTMVADYTKKTDLTPTEARLVSEIERSAAGITSTVAEQYAKKTDLASIESGLQTQITQNAEAITSTAASVTAVDTKASNAQSAADTARTAAAKAQTDATAAAGNAAAAQTAADAAAANLAVAEANLDAVSIRVGATEADVAAAELAVENAKAAADAAAASATTAKTNAATAQATADAAKSAAAKAQSAADDLGARVTSAETKITQNAEAIVLRATKAEVDTAKGQAISSASADAKSKADAALAGAKSYADAQIKVQADRITSSAAATDALGARVSTVEQTASGLSVSLESVEATANSANATASTARTEAANAAKTASNYMQYTVDGLEVGNRSSGAWSGFRSRMAAGAFQVLDAAGNVLSSFGSDLIELGKRSTSAKISLLANNGSIIGFGTPQLRGLAIASDRLSLCAKAPAESGYAIAPKIEIDSGSVSLPNGVTVGGTAVRGDGTWVYGKGAAFTSICTNQSNSYPVYGGRVLYDNAAGSAGTVTLAESAANFKHMRIYFVDNNGNGYASLDVWEPNGKQPILAMIEGNSNSQTLIRRTKYAINGTTLAPSGINGERGYLCFSTGSIINNDMTVSYVRVIAVVGYK